jgi:hypothetical protein
MKAIKLSCPSCEKVVRLDEETATARARCPKCGSTLRAPRLPRHAATAEEPEDDGAEKRQSYCDEAAAWAKVRVGLLVLLIVTAVGLLAGIVGHFMLAFAVRWLVAHVWTGSGFLTLLVVWTACQMVATLASYILLGFTPQRYAPRGLIVAVVVLAVLTEGAAVFVFTYVARAIFTDGGMADAIVGMRRLTLFMIPVQLMGALQVILLPLFLRQMSLAMENARGAHLCEMIVKWTCISLGIQLAGPVLALLPLRLIMMVSGFIGMAGFLLSGATRVAYIYVAFCLREGIADHARKLRRRRKKRAATKTRAATKPPEPHEDD